MMHLPPATKDERKEGIGSLVSWSLTGNKKLTIELLTFDLVTNDHHANATQTKVKMSINLQTN